MLTDRSQETLKSSARRDGRSNHPEANQNYQPPGVGAMGEPGEEAGGAATLLQRLLHVVHTPVRCGIGQRTNRMDIKQARTSSRGLALVQKALLNLLSKGDLSRGAVIGLSAWLICIAGPVGTGDISRSMAHLDELQICSDEPDEPRPLGSFALAQTISGFARRHAQAPG